MQAIQKNRILIIIGNAPEGQFTFQVTKHFHTETIKFFREVFGAGDMSELNKTIVPTKFPNTYLFSDPCDSSINCNNNSYYLSSLFPILKYEAKKVGYEPIFVALDNFFTFDNNRELVIAGCWKKVLDEIEIIAVSTTFITSYSLLYKMVDILKKEEKKIILGGAFIGKLPHKALESIAMDFCLVSEAEGRFSRLLEIIKKPLKSSELNTIQGLCWYEKNKGIKHSSAKLKSIDLNTINLEPDREWIKENRGIIPYEGSRGCAYRCAFCSYPYLLGNNRLRFKTARKIFEEWVALFSLGARYIRCYDATFTTPIHRIKELCSLIKSSGMNKSLSWSVTARVSDLLDSSVLECMQEAGCKFIFLGIESGDQNILENMNKKTTVKENADVIQNCNKVGICSTTSIIVGFPGETEETIKNTKYFLQRNPSPNIRLHTWIPDPSPNVPICRPENVSRFQIEINNEPVSYRTNIYGDVFDFNMALSWKHVTMNQSQAFRYSLDISESIRIGDICAEDDFFAPYRSFLPQPAVLASFFDYQEHVNFILGLKDMYNKFISGINAELIKKDMSSWLESSGCRQKKI